jgi:hypothetical protein
MERLVCGPPFQPAGEGAFQAIGEPIIHVEQSLERPSADDLVAGLPIPISDLTLHMRRTTNGPSAAGSHAMSPVETLDVD